MPLRRVGRDVPLPTARSTPPPHPPPPPAPQVAPPRPPRGAKGSRLRREATPPPPDIVIYNKYVTRTVAVDSSADSAEPDLDDLFSVDAAFENSAELEGSGVSALDAAPSADDSTGAQDTAATSGTQDTVLTPSPLTRRRSSPPKSRWTALTPLHPAP